jgi:putative heme-binding domain-containing protein
MYFVTGGRGTQAGLYRVSWVGGPGGVTETIPAPDKTAAGAREARRKLEAFHGRADPKAVAAVWSSLGSEDRFIRYAARIALEHQPVDPWRERALNEAHTGTALTALLAFARVAPKSSQVELLRALDRFPLDKLDEPARLLKLRILQLAFLRQGRPEAELMDLTRRELDPCFPAGSWEQNRELLRLLTWIEAPSTVAKALTLLDKAPTQEQQLHYIEQLRHVVQGWTLADRRRYFQWWTRSRDDARHPPELLRWFADVDRQYVDGAWLDRYLNQFRRNAIDTLTETDRDELASLLKVPVRQARLVPSHNRGFVRDWTMADLLPHLQQAASRRDFESGRQAFVDAQCLACHRMGNDGGSIGPELNSAGSKYDRRTLLESILEPSKVLNEQYSNHTIRLKSGDDITGRIVSEEGDNLVVETNPFGGEQEEIDRKDILEIQPARVSPMPEGLASVLTRDEILALIAYLQSGGRKDAFASTPRDPGQD